jgi:hypothetical protein
VPSKASWPAGGIVCVDVVTTAPLALYKVKVTGALVVPGFTTAKPVEDKSVAVNDLGKFSTVWLYPATGRANKNASSGYLIRNSCLLR